MEEFLLYIETLKHIIDTDYGKEAVFYEEGKWYSREHCRNISPEELTEWVLRIVEPRIIDSDICDETNDKSDELCPVCGSELQLTYDIKRECKFGEDPRIYGVICSNCWYEKYDEQI